IHASQPIRTTFTGQWFASSFLQTPPHDDALAFGCTLPTAGRVRDFHPLERVPAGHTAKAPVSHSRKLAQQKRSLLFRFAQNDNTDRLPNCPGGEATLFLASEDYENCKRLKQTKRHPPICRCK